MKTSSSYVKARVLFLLFILAMGMFAMVSCADSKTFKDKNGKEFTAEPYGWANSDARKLDTVVYEANIGNVIWSVILVETVAVPVWLTGWQIMEPVRLKQPGEK